MRFILPALAVCILVAPATASDMNVTTDFADFTSQEFQHEDSDPWKGWATITVTNTGSEPWGDFHFQITGLNIENVDIIADAPYAPYVTPAMPSLNVVVDNTIVGATADFTFYSDPVTTGETVTFHLYTDNTTDENPFFGLCMYPTPVPEPASLLLLTLGGLFIRRRR